MTTDPILTLSPSILSWIRVLAFGLAIATLAGGWVAREQGWLDYRPGGAAFTGVIRLVFLGVFLVGTLVAVRYELIGAIIALFAAAALVGFAFKQLETSNAIVVVMMFAVPALLWAILDLADQPRRLAALGLVGAVVAMIAGLITGVRTYDHVWGRQHPASTITSLPDSPVRWVWSGAVHSSGGEVRLKTDDTSEVRLGYAIEADFSDVQFVESTDRYGGISRFDLDGFAPGTVLHYAAEVDGTLDLARRGRFTTFPDGPASFTVTLGACARVGSNGAVFDAIADQAPIQHVIVGDFHYGDVPDNDRERFEEVLDLTLTRPAQASLYAQTPISYVWDDHDYGANDSDFDSPSREAAMQSYRAYVPSYELAGEETPVFQAYSIGRVRFILTDARSGRIFGDSMWGAQQTAWFEDELLRSSREHAAVVWVNPVPWIADAEEGADHWGGFAEERRNLADLIASNDIDNLLMVAGDAHMIAIDDGTNTDYSTAGGAGFPLVHVAALDRPGGTKGGPYSEGAYPGAGQFVSLEFDDLGDQINITIAGRTWNDEVLVEHEVSFPA